MNDRLREIEARVAALELGREIDLDGLRDCYIQDVRHLLAQVKAKRWLLRNILTHLTWLGSALGDDHDQP